MAKSKATTGKEKVEGKDNSNAKARLKELGMPPTLIVQVGEQSILATCREFSTGSVGYNASGKVMVGSENTPCQVGINIIAIGTKPS